jgi:hypothetical protein
MFTYQEIKARALMKPFTPFRVVTSSGQTFDVPHPDMIWVGARDIQIGNPSSRDPTIYDGVSRIAILHITALQDLPVPLPPPTTNGQTP